MRRVTGIFLVLLLAFPLLLLSARAAGLEVAAKSAVLMDAATGTVLFESNAHEPLAPASVTKVMTMLLIMEALDSGQITPEDTVTASEAAAAKGGSQIYLKVGETMSVSDMLKSIAVSSANDCACAMAEHLWGSEGAFVEQMNRRAAELGMADTHFVNCTGLDDGADAAQHRTSAYDIALMSRELLTKHPDIKKFTTIWMDSVRGGAFGLSNTNKLIRFYPGATGLKTGFTSGAGYCLSATAEREGMELIAVVMGCETSQERTAACKSMLDYGFAGYTLVQPDLQEPVRVPVILGKAEDVPLELSQPEGILIEKGQKTKITFEAAPEAEVKAPVEKGQVLGTLTVKAEGHAVKEIPLVASRAVDRLRWSDLFVLVLRRAAMAKPETETE